MQRLCHLGSMLGITRLVCLRGKVVDGKVLELVVLMCMYKSLLLLMHI